MELGELETEMRVDGAEALREVEAAWLALESHCSNGTVPDPAVVHQAFRGMHTLKGVLGFLDAPELHALAHAAESVLSALRTPETRLPATEAGLLAEALSVLESGLDALGSGEAQSDPRTAELTAALEATDLAQAPEPTRQTTRKRPRLPVPPPPSAPRVPVPPPPRAQPTAGENRPQSRDAGDIRVALSKLDTLVDLVGELVLAENALDHEHAAMGVRPHAAEALNRVSRALQDLARSVRLVPIRDTFRRMGRVANDIARREGKQLDLVLDGEDTEVDKTVIEAVGEPLLHLVRNACDHGLESPETRTAQGKSPRGTLRLSARHESGEVRVTIADDGRGLDTERILERAREAGLVHEDDVLTRAEIERLVFTPGLSTKTEVSDLSGRGVGMDVVANRVASVGGSIDLETEPGRGTTWSIRLPLTLAILDGLLFARGEHTVAIPLAHIDALVPAADLARDLPIATASALLGPCAEPVLYVVLLHGERHSALPVDALLGQQQLVVKPMPRLLGATPGWSGCTVLGDGGIGFVLDARAVLEDLDV